MIPTGSAAMDEFLEGYEEDIISTIYGPAGAGKTLMCLMAAISTAISGKKVVYIDTEGVSIERIKQLTTTDVFKNIYFLKPTTFAEQKEAFAKLKEIANEKIGLVIVDTISMLYRLEIGKTEDVYSVNKELGVQIGHLNEIARKKKIPVLVTNQVYADFYNKNKVKLVGGDLLKYGTKCMIELQNMNAGIRKAVLRKHRSKKEKYLLFRIVEKGIEKIEQKKIIM